MAEVHQFKRQYPRRSFDSPVGALVRGDYGVSRAGSIGEGGMLVYLNHDLKVGDMLVVTFQIPGSEFVCIKAEIRSEGKDASLYGRAYGIQFKSINFSQKRLIRNFVSARVESAADI